jgi:hypothetical protein
MSVVFTLSKASNAYGVTMDWDIERGSMNATDATLMMNFAKQVTKRAQSDMMDTASFRSNRTSTDTKLGNYKGIIENIIKDEEEESGFGGTGWATVEIS